MVIWLTKIGGQIRVSDRELFLRCNEKEPVAIGFPLFEFKLESLLNCSRDNFIYFANLKEGKSIKMVLKEWPIE